VIRQVWNDVVCDLAATNAIDRVVPLFALTSTDVCTETPTTPPSIVCIRDGNPGPAVVAIFHRNDDWELMFLASGLKCP
jgi:hypothetical protein